MRQKLFVVASGGLVNTSAPNELAGGGAVYVAAGILARRGAGLPARRIKPRAKQTAMDCFGRDARFGRLFRAAGCRPLRQAGKPAATLRDGADAPEVVRGGVRRVGEHQRPE